MCVVVDGIRVCGDMGGDADRCILGRLRVLRKDGLNRDRGRGM